MQAPYLPSNLVTAVDRVPDADRLPISQWSAIYILANSFRQISHWSSDVGGYRRLLRFFSFGYNNNNSKFHSLLFWIIRLRIQWKWLSLHLTDPRLLQINIFNSNSLNLRYPWSLLNHNFQCLRSISNQIYQCNSQKYMRCDQNSSNMVGWHYCHSYVGGYPGELCMVIFAGSLDYYAKYWFCYFDFGKFIVQSDC